jgi:hypothetical protein
MAKFLVLYRSPVSAEEQMGSATPEQAQAGMEEWNKWGAKVGSALVDFGSPVTHAGAVGAASSIGGEGFIGGYSFLEAGSVDELRTLLAGHPHLMLEGASIEILELLPVPGM